MFQIIYLSVTALCFVILTSMYFNMYEVFQDLGLDEILCVIVITLGICCLWFIVLPIGLLVGISYLIGNSTRKLTRKKND